MRQSDVREQMVAAMAASDLSDLATAETAIDRVRALAFADQLGVSLWRLLYANQEDAYNKVVHLLSRRLRRKHEPLKPLLRLCAVAVMERIDRLCKECGGRGVRATDLGVRHVCTACNGSGMAAPSAITRRRKLGLSSRAYARLEPKFARAHELMANADKQALLDVNAQLGHSMRSK